jgi:hypothetical protein
MMSRPTRGERYLSRLSDADLSLLVQSNDDLRRSERPVEELRTRPDLIESLIADPTSFEAVFGSIASENPVHIASPFLLFSVAVQRTAAELERANYITEWFGPRQRMPVFDVRELREFLADFEHRYFLTELLASYTHVSSGSVVVATRRGFRRQRFSELDMIRLASLAESTSGAQASPIYRRLGDLALFLTGVFPDHTALKGFSEIDQARLLRAAGLRPGVSDQPTGMPDFGQSAVELLEKVGARFYRTARELDTYAPPATHTLLEDLTAHFRDARRVLNVITDSFLFPFRTRWFGIGSS